MILSDILSRQKHDDSNPHDIIPISFSMYNILYKQYYNLGLMDKYLVQTQSHIKSSGIILPEVHGVKKILRYKFTTRKAEASPSSEKRIRN